MANTLRIKRRAAGGAAGAPASLANAELAGDTVRLGPLTVTMTANSHFDHDGKSGEQAVQSLSYRFQIGDRSITYSGDTGPSNAVTALARNTDILVSEVIDLDPIMASIRQRRPDMDASTFSQMQTHMATHHITAGDLGRLASEAGVGRLVLTHFAIPPGPLRNSETGLREGIGQPIVARSIWR